MSPRSLRRPRRVRCKGATQAGAGCPSGTEEINGSCIPTNSSSSSSDSSGSNAASSAGAAASTGTLSPESSSTSTSPTPPAGATSLDSLPAGADKEAVLAQLTRQTRQVKKNCAGATGEDGTKGPFGTTTVSIRLSRDGNGHAVSMASDFDGKPSGTCVMNAFKHFQYPPWEGSSVTIQWDVEVPEK